VKVETKQYPEIVAVELDHADLVSLMRGHRIEVGDGKHQVTIQPPFAGSEHRSP
jgi:hypothetical protein